MHNQLAQRLFVGLLIMATDGRQVYFVAHCGNSKKNLASK